jgi:hypothetical protein
MLSDGQPSVGIDPAFHRAVNEQLFLKFNCALIETPLDNIPPDRGNSTARLAPFPS